MKITEINAIPKDFELEKPFKFASCTLTKLPYVLVQVKTDEGITGYGECPAYWDPSGETQESAVGAINFIRGGIVGKQPSQIEKIMNFFDSQAYGAFSAKCGLDMALYDINGKRLGVPAHELLAGNNYEVKVNAVIPLTTKENAAEIARKFSNDGFEYFKVKVGIDLQKELEILDAISGAVGKQKKIFVDANQGWNSPKEAIRSIRKMEKHDLAWVEQPIRAFDWSGLKEVKNSVDVPVMADESLYSYQDAFKMAKNSIVDMFNIKLAKSGGMYLGSKIKTIADAANIPCVLGSMIESSLGMLADYHFAKSYEMKVCGLSASGYIKNNYDFGLKMEGDKLVLKRENPGLGYPDEDVLKNEFKR